MSDESNGLSKRLDGDLARRWRSADGEITKFLRENGLTGEQHSKALYFFPRLTTNLQQSFEELRIATAKDGTWFFMTGNSNGKPSMVAWPVADQTPPEKLLLALYVEVHSRLVSWWLINAWRSEQLAGATWWLGDHEQIVPAAACARSLVETAAAFWVDSRELRELWRSIKAQAAKEGPKITHWHQLTRLIWRMVWAAKFDSKVPDLAKKFEGLPRTNVLGYIEKLQRATSAVLQRDYQWLCNAVHPSIGGMLAFTAPMVVHKTGTSAFQYVAPFATHFVGEGRTSAEITIDEAVARSASLAVAVLRETLDATLRIIDDIALTTGAPTMASFRYWRMVSQESPDAPCPCRSGREAKNCPHDWAAEPPQITERFEDIACSRDAL